MLNDLLYGIKIWAEISLFCHNPRVWQQTDRQLARS